MVLEILPRFPVRQASLQYFTLAQSRAHFFRQTNGRLHAAQTFSGRFSLFTPRMVRRAAGGEAGNQAGVDDVFWLRKKHFGAGARDQSSRKYVSARHRRK